MRVPLALAAIVLLAAGCASTTDNADAPSNFEAIRFETSAGVITAILFCDETPKTCTFMRGLVESGYYDGRSFGRVIPGFVIQEVDRTGGTSDQSERVEAEFGTNVHFSAGAIGIARDADPDSGGSEFFIMDFATGHLYGNYTAFAQVIEGMDVVHAIARVPAVRTGPASSVVGAPPGSPVTIGLHDRVPIDPPTINKARMTTLPLRASDAAHYPLIAGERYATDTLRATLEWPGDLAMGHTATLRWYVTARDPGQCDALPRDPCSTDPNVESIVTGATAQDPPPVDLTGASIRFEGPQSGTLAFEEDTTVRGQLTIRWTPPTAGDFHLVLEQGRTTLATADIIVRS